jgi:hypothetical protein
VPRFDRTYTLLGIVVFPASWTKAWTLREKTEMNMATPTISLF